MKVRFVSFIVLIQIILISCQASWAEGENLLKNPSFEEEKNGKPLYWTMESWDKNIEAVEFKTEDKNVYSGNKCATITCNSDNDARYLQNVSVAKDKIYKYSGWIRTEGVSDTGAGANLSIGNQLVAAGNLKGTNNEWIYAEMYIKIGEGIDSINLTAGVGGYSSISLGKASFDELAFEEVDNIPDNAITAFIQKVEHLEIDGGEEDKGDSDNKKIELFWIVFIIMAVLISLSTFFLIAPHNKIPNKNESVDENSFDNDIGEDEFQEKFGYQNKSKYDKKN
jgi:hypothetical protein